MIYNFDEIIDREGNRAAKYDERKKKFGREDVIPLWIADMDFKVARPIIDALKDRAEEGIWGYTSRPASYFESICNWKKQRHGWEIEKDLIGFSLGVVQTLASAVKILTEIGDNVMIQTPVYSEFYDMVELSDRKVLENKLILKEGEWQIDFLDFEEKAKNSKLFLLCNPHNPLGIVWSREELKRMIDICIENDVYVVSDEIHSDLIFHDKVFVPAATLSDEIRSKIIVCISGTKTFNLAGLQASSVVYPNKEMKKRFDDFWQSMDIHRNNAFSSVAMEVAFNEGGEWLEQVLSYISDNFDFVKDYCEKNIPKIKPNCPDATYLMWLDCRELDMDNGKLNDFMINKAGLGLNSGESFGRSLRGYMRLNAACPRGILEKAMMQLSAAVKEYESSEMGK